jgi:Ni,Fe-hydrogenase I small subunit
MLVQILFWMALAVIAVGTVARWKYITRHCRQERAEARLHQLASSYPLNKGGCPMVGRPTR